MTARHLMLGLGALAGAAALAACDTTGDVGPASAATTTTSTTSADKVNPACDPGNTPAGTASGLRCTPGSSTATPPGIDSNVQGASTQGQVSQ